MLLLQGIVGHRYLLSFDQGWSNVSFAKGDKKGSIKAPITSIWRIKPTLITAATQTLQGHFTL